jgi:hypothetical protein
MHCRLAPLCDWRMAAFKPRSGPHRSRSANHKVHLIRPETGRRFGCGELMLGGESAPDEQHGPSGLRTDGPELSGPAPKIGPYRDWFSGLFSAGYMNNGPEVDCCAPGAGIASTMPQGPTAWHGTSMAYPVITGLLAVAFEGAGLMTAPRLFAATRTVNG